MLLDLVLRNKELAGNVMVGGSLGCSNHKMELGILQGRSRARIRIVILDFKRANFGLFRDFLGRIPSAGP